jgi:drug/metabolite transporter (DMT)-like permease
VPAVEGSCVAFLRRARECGPARGTVCGVSTPPSPVTRPAAAVHSRTAALVLLALLSLVWGVHWVVVKIGLDYMPPFTYATLRVAAGLVTMVALLGAQGRLRRPPRGDVSIVLSVGVAQIAAGVLIMNLALQAVPAGRSSVLVYTMPLWVAVLLAVFFRVRPRPNELAGLALGLAGIVVLVNPSVIDWSVPGEVWGTLALVFNAVLWAAVTIHVRRHHWIATPLELQPWQLLAALVPCAVFAVALEVGEPVVWTPVTVLVLLYSGPLATAFATWASQSITRSLGPQASATGFLAVPVIGLVSGAVVLGEELGIVDLAGFGLVLGGIAVTSLLARRGGAPGEAAEAEPLPLGE